MGASKDETSGIFFIWSQERLKLSTMHVALVIIKMGRVKDQTWMLVPTFHVVPVMISQMRDLIWRLEGEKIENSG